MVNEALRTATHVAFPGPAVVGRPPWCPLSEVRAPPLQNLVANFGKSWALATLLLRVPLIGLKSPNELHGLPSGDFRSAALV
jgi:hypothetical protein